MIKKSSRFSAERFFNSSPQGSAPGDDICCLQQQISSPGPPSFLLVARTAVVTLFAFTVVLYRLAYPCAALRYASYLGFGRLFFLLVVQAAVVTL